MRGVFDAVFAHAQPPECAARKTYRDVGCSPDKPASHDVGCSPEQLIRHEVFCSPEVAGSAFAEFMRKRATLLQAACQPRVDSGQPGVLLEVTPVWSEQELMFTLPPASGPTTGWSGHGTRDPLVGGRGGTSHTGRGRGRGRGGFRGVAPRGRGRGGFRGGHAGPPPEPLAAQSAPIFKCVGARSQIQAVILAVEKCDRLERFLRDQIERFTNRVKMVKRKFFKILKVRLLATVVDRDVRKYSQSLLQSFDKALEEIGSAETSKGVARLQHACMQEQHTILATPSTASADFCRQLQNGCNTISTEAAVEIQRFLKSSGAQLFNAMFSETENVVCEALGQHKKGAKSGPRERKAWQAFQTHVGKRVEEGFTSLLTKMIIHWEEFEVMTFEPWTTCMGRADKMYRLEIPLHI